MLKPLDTEGLFSLLKTLKEEDTESSKRAVSEIFPRVYPSRRGNSCIRYFPEGCGRKTSLSGNEVGVEANPSKANRLEHEISCLKGVSFAEAIQSDTHKSKAVMKILPSAYPPQRRTSATRCFPKNCGSKVSQISQCSSMNHPEGKACIDFALKCPWRRAKGVRKLNSKRGIGKGKKHYAS